jgi:hypothetical protein
VGVRRLCSIRRLGGVRYKRQVQREEEGQWRGYSWKRTSFLSGGSVKP